MSGFADTTTASDAIHRRFNPLTNSWVLCSPHRTKRPWLGQNEKSNDAPAVEYDPKCFLCPRNQRSGIPVANPDYTSTFTFTNDFPALTFDEPAKAAPSSIESSIESTLLQSHTAHGTCKVICYSPNHSLTLAEMDNAAIATVIEAWVNVEAKIATDHPEVKYVQVFENKGAVMGCSNPHGHNQVWATDYIPHEPKSELSSLVAFKKSHANKCLLCSYSTLESEKTSRLVYENASFLVLVPYWAVWPFETMILSKTHVSSLAALDSAEKLLLADAIRNITTRYDNLFETSFPYSMGIHGAPVNAAAEAGGEEEEYVAAAHLHMHFYPPLLRSATVKKFLVGYEMLGEAQRDLTAEMAAERLRAVDGNLHYKRK
ncbi:galactose-1-phosphate uridyl transferase [Physocladia obscura]|uniref:Galactose-1-phosphate uridylyltransferase n=1 Tax=Physocladia obscura TaxID=109957 RepID=A0AAD5SSK0_9FUNG|nr:galactose-1-phosphate uridyl transferase [Physocladia obscura]